MKDSTSPVWIKAKGILFLLPGLAAAALLVLENPDWETVFLLALAIWSFRRFYCFAFYVIEHDADSSCKFPGLGSFACHLARRRRQKN